MSFIGDVMTRNVLKADSKKVKTVTVIIKKLKRHFVTHGTHNELLSGNEPPFNSAEFMRTFCDHLGLSM